MKLTRRDLAYHTPGWFAPEEGDCLRKWALTTAGPYLELGSYCGKSTIWLGDAAEEKGTLVYAVDWHRGSPEIREGLGDTLPYLRKTIAAADLEAVVIPIVGTTDSVGRYWRTPVSCCFIDGDHGPQAVKDVDTWERHVTDVLAFHDSTFEHVAVAIRRAREVYGWRPVETVRSVTVLGR